MDKRVKLSQMILMACGGGFALCMVAGHITAEHNTATIQLFFVLR